MKTFEDALRVVFLKDRKTVELVNLADISATVLQSDAAKSYLQMISLSLPSRSPKGFKKRDIAASIALTAFVSGIRVGQEMEKREL